MLAYSHFISKGKLVHRHQCAVLEVKGDFALILPTSSLDATASRAQNVVGEVSPEDRKAAGWTNRCVWLVDSLQWVPASWLAERPGVQFSKATRVAFQQLARVGGPRAPRHTVESTAHLSMAFKRHDKERAKA